MISSVRSSGSKPAGAPRSFVPYSLRAGRAIEFLLAKGTLPVLYWLKKDILAVPVEREARNLEKFAERIRIVESQNADGSWNKKRPAEPTSYEQENLLFEAIRNVFKLYDLGCEGNQNAVRKAIGFIFSMQSREGAFQGPDRPEQSPITHALALELLCRFGLDTDKRVHRGFRWLLKDQQADGGWLVPRRTDDTPAFHRRDKVRPTSSHRVTGVVLRALAGSSQWQKSREARRAGNFLAGGFFQDKAGFKTRGSSCWEEMTYPFWATNILSSLDVLSRIGFKPDTGGIPKALDWLVRRQLIAGYWESMQGKASAEDHLWVTLAVLRVLKGFGIFSR